MTDATAPIERFVALLGAARPPTGGARLDSVEAEVTAILPMLADLPLEERGSDDFTSVRFRECFTLLTLLGRRLALLDLTPTAALQVAEIALAAAAGEGELPPARFGDRARVAMVEGFVRGREEQVTQVAEHRAARAVRPLRVDASTFALIALGQLGEPTRERARAIFAADSITRMLGATCLFSGVDFRWRQAAEEAQLHLDRARIVRNFADALDAARSISRPKKVRTAKGWLGLLDRWRR